MNRPMTPSRGGTHTTSTQAAGQEGASVCHMINTFNYKPSVNLSTHPQHGQQAVQAAQGHLPDWIHPPPPNEVATQCFVDHLWPDLHHHPPTHPRTRPYARCRHIRGIHLYISQPHLQPQYAMRKPLSSSATLAPAPLHMGLQYTPLDMALQYTSLHTALQYNTLPSPSSTAPTQPHLRHNMSCTRTSAHQPHLLTPPPPPKMALQCLPPPPLERPHHSAPPAATVCHCLIHAAPSPLKGQRTAGPRQGPAVP
jgi:hypothetical protein